MGDMGLAFDKKLQDIFNWYVEKSKEFENFYDFTNLLEKKLTDSNLNMNAAMFVHKVFDELEFPNKRLWSPNYEDLLVFIDSLPQTMWKKHWNVIMHNVKRDDWGRYNKRYAKAATTFIESLSHDPLILVEEDSKKNLIFSVFLGDITGKLGITKEYLSNRYDDVYDVIEQELGCEKIKQYLPKNIEVLDWPNASILTNAKYEFRVRAQNDPAILDIQNNIFVALNKLGL